MKEEYFKWYSPNLGMEIEMLAVGHSGRPVVIFPTTLGRYYEAKDFHLINSIKWFVDHGLIKVYCPDGVNNHSWYNKSVHPSVRVKNHTYYDQFVAQEIIEKIRHDSPNGRVIVAGCSFGGFTAANFAFKYPYYVSHLISMSGSFDIKSFMDGHYDNNVYFNNPVDYIPNADHHDLWNLGIILGTSEWDICKDSNYKMSGILGNKNIAHWLDVYPQSQHDWPLWRDMFPKYLGRILK